MDFGYACQRGWELTHRPRIIELISPEIVVGKEMAVGTDLHPARFQSQLC